MELNEVIIYIFAMALGSGIIVAFFRLISSLFGEEKQ